jgi:alkanesulfonate monooxygenase SsuD/methylene tetrahydromethanopterin reductase-like flavin-dependent oxidoreductase (luciferase family)
MHLTVSLNGNGGYHPAAWRLSAAGHVSASAFRDLTTLAERGGIAATLFGLSFDDPAMRTTGRIPLVRPDALPLVASLIAHTETIGLGMTFGLERSEPFNIARSFATLDRLSSGRTAWIIELARPSDGDGRDAECIEVVRKLWDSWEDEAFLVDKARGLVADPAKVHRIDHAGPHFSVRGPLNGPRPTQGHPVLVVMDPGDVGGRTIAGRFADLLVVNCGDSESARQIRLTARSLAAAASRDPDALKVLMNVFPVLAPTEAEARSRYSELGDAVAPGLAFVGTPEELANQLADLHASQACDGFNIIPPVLPDDLRLIAERTIPLLKQRGLVPAPARGRTLRDRLSLIHPRSRYAAQST